MDDRIEAWAREAGFTVADAGERDHECGNIWARSGDPCDALLARFAAVVRAAALDDAAHACAKRAMHPSTIGRGLEAMDCAAAIRALATPS